MLIRPPAHEITDSPGFCRLPILLRHLGLECERANASAAALSNDPSDRRNLGLLRPDMNDVCGFIEPVYVLEDGGFRLPPCCPFPPSDQFRLQAFEERLDRCVHSRSNFLCQTST
jgi:hypothetical protein